MLDFNLFGRRSIWETVFRTNDKLKIYGSVGVFTGLLFYILGPDIKRFFLKSLPSNKPSRFDKYTTGLINPGNDCFINSPLQALAGSKRFNHYLNSMLQVTFKINQNLRNDNIALLLHLTMAELINELQLPTNKQKVTSAKPIIKVLEIIMKAKISRKQNDAHEFLQTLQEIMFQEYSALSKIIKSNRLKINLPQFPFQGTYYHQLRCLTCGKTSEPQSFEFGIMSLNLANQTNSVPLENLISGLNGEIIEDYSCQYCKVKLILANCTQDMKKDQMIQDIQKSVLNLKINDQFPEPLQSFIDTYNFKGVNTKIVKTKIVKATVFTKLPDILVLQVSRSMFNGYSYSVNSCKIEFKQKMALSSRSQENSPLLSTVFELSSIVKHSGSHSAGHYQCYRRKLFSKTFEPINTKLIRKIEGHHPTTHYNSLSPNILRKTRTVCKYPFWWVCDNRTEECTTSRMLGQQSNVYMLFYDKRPATRKQL